MNKKYLFWGLLWPVMLLPKIMQLAFFLILGVCLSFPKLKNASKVFIFVCVYACIHLFSIVINYIIGDFDLSRTAAAVNTALIWVAAALLYEYYRTTQIDLKKVLGIFFINENIMLVLLAIYAYMAYVQKSTDCVLPVANTILFNFEWPLYRFWGLMEYPTLVGAFSMLLVPFASLHVWLKSKKIKVVLFYYIICFLPIYFSFSRNGYVLYIGMLVASLLIIYMYAFKKEQAYTTLVIAVGVVLVFIPVIFGMFSELFEELFMMRRGSNFARTQIYTASMQAFYESPVWGRGIKELNELFLPLGSHCSYIGYLYKTGILGTFFIICAFIMLVVNIWKNKQGVYQRLMSFFIFAMLIYCVFEDLDGANWLVCLFFVEAGILENRENKWQRGELR